MSHKDILLNISKMDFDCPEKRVLMFTIEFMSFGQRHSANIADLLTRGVEYQKPQIGECFLSFNTLSKITGLSIWSLGEICVALQKDGLLDLNHEGGDKPVRFTLVLDGINRDSDEKPKGARCDEHNHHFKS